MRNAVVLSCGMLVLQILACGSNDDGSTTSGSGGTSNSTSSSTDTTPDSSSGGGTADSSNGGATNDSNPSTGGKTSSPSAGGTTSSGGTTGNNPDTTAEGGGTPDTSLTPGSPHAGKLMINEVVPSNKTGATEGGSFPDWLELYNSSGEDISLKDFYITDDNAELTKYQITQSTLIVKAGGVLVLWADGDVGETDFHLGFSLSAAGETVTLLDAEQKVIDSVTWTNAETDKSYSRLPDGTGAFSWCPTGTSNRKNGSACE